MNSDTSDCPVLEKVYIPAENHHIALEAAVRAVDELTDLLSTTTSTTVRSRLREQLSALDSEIGRLELIPSREAGWEYQETGSTYSQVWLNIDQDEKRKLIIAKSIAVRAIKDTELHWYLETTKSPPQKS